MEKLIITYQFKSQIKLNAIIEKFNNFKNELIESKVEFKFIILTIELVYYNTNKNENTVIELCDQFKTSILRKRYDKLNSTINNNIKIINKQSHLEFKTLNFDEIRFIYSPISYSQYISLDDSLIKLNKIIKKVKTSK